MNETIEKTSKADLFKSLAKAQKMVFAATKDAKNPFFNSKYATLAEVLSVVRDPLADNGFALVQDADTDIINGTVGVISKLLHESGEELCSPRLSASLKPEYSKNNIELPPSVQQIGSMVTYLRRYSLCAFLSVAIEDDDGNSVSGSFKSTPPETSSFRRSAHTGEKLETKEAVQRHMEAATKPASKKEVEAPPVVTPDAPKPTATTTTEDKAAFNAPLYDLMERDGITEAELQTIVAKKGYFPADTPIHNYPVDFVNGSLIACWPKVKGAIIASR